MVAAKIPVPAGVRAGELRYALSDDATRSNNRAPVDITVRAGRAVLARAAADNRPGLRRLPFTLTGSTALTLEIRTANDGARVFGFDVAWKTP